MQQWQCELQLHIGVMLRGAGQTSSAMHSPAASSACSWLASHTGFV